MIKTITCDMCGSHFTLDVRGQAPKRCSEECRREAARTYKGVGTCTVEDCGRTTRRKNYCDKHYQQVKNFGRVLHREKLEECSFDGCGKTPRSSYAEYCEAHYYRIRRNGTLEIVARRIPDAKCRVEGCESMAGYVSGECRNHYLGFQRNGDYEKRVGKGKSYNWLSDEKVNYNALHQRLRNYRGSAREHSCVDCGGDAKHWSYDHLSDGERLGRTGKYLVPFSPNLEDYSPRCVPCHKKMDIEMAEARSNGA